MIISPPVSLVVCWKILSFLFLALFSCFILIWTSVLYTVKLLQFITLPILPYYKYIAHVSLLTYMHNYIDGYIAASQQDNLNRLCRFFCVHIPLQHFMACRHAEENVLDVRSGRLFDQWRVVHAQCPICLPNGKLLRHNWQLKLGTSRLPMKLQSSVVSALCSTEHTVHPHMNSWKWITVVEGSWVTKSTSGLSGPSCMSGGHGLKGKKEETCLIEIDPSGIDNVNLCIQADSPSDWRQLINEPWRKVAAN